MRSRVGLWSVALGVTGFVCGFFGPIVLNPSANQGPLLGILITGPGGAVLGAILGALTARLNLRQAVSRRLLTTAAVLLAIHLLCGVARAQAFLPEDNLAYPVQIVVSGGGGTGFFVRKDREVFLVTAMHVLFDLRTGQLQSREATLRALSKDVKETAVTVVRVNTASATRRKTDSYGCPSRRRCCTYRHSCAGWVEHHARCCVCREVEGSHDRGSVRILVSL